MKFHYTLILLILSTVYLQGCETTEGIKRDIQNIASGERNEDTMIYKIDAWLQEHFW